MKSVTIIEIAEKAGVSMKTVSRVLNGEPNVREETRRKVEEVADKLNYKPNVSARSLASKRSFVIAHFHDNPSPDYLEKVYNGIHHTCRSSGYFAVMEPLATPYAKSARDYLDKFQIDGVILTPPLSDNSALIELLNEQQVPVVRLSPRFKPKLTSSVFIDEREAMKEMAEHLIELGHSRIAFVGGPADHGAARKRETGFRDAIKIAGLELDKCPILDGNFSVRSGFDAAEKVLRKPGSVTAIAAANDDMAVGVVMSAMKQGLEIPRDLSVTGFDGSRLGNLIWPPLTTVRQPVVEMAEHVTEILLKEIVAKGSDKQEVEFPVSHLIRNTTKQT